MSMRALESAVLNEARRVVGKSTLRMKDIAEWSTGEVKAQAGETLFHLPGLKVNIAVTTSALPKRAAIQSATHADRDAEGKL